MNWMIALQNVDVQKMQNTSQVIRNTSIVNMNHINL